jgi:hypothetical protein
MEYYKAIAIRSFVVLLLLSFTTCTKDRHSNLDNLVSFRKIWSNNSYSAFTDLIKHENKWYCVFREAASHVGSEGVIRVLVSDNAEDWSSQTVLKIEGTDLRDPKFLIGFKNELNINIGAVQNREVNNLVWSLKKDSGWAGPYDMDVRRDWLWRISREQNEMFTMAYLQIAGGPPAEALSLYSSDTSIFPRFRLLRRNVSANECLSENTLYFQKDRTMIILARRDCGTKTSMLGISSPPYTDVKWTDLKIVLESPNMIGIKDDIYVAGRTYNPGDKTVLFKLNLNERKLEKIIDLPSGLDTGYPGLYNEDNMLWISYYSAENEQHRAIYLCKYKLY